MQTWLWDNAEKLGAIAGIAGFAATIVALIFAVVQISASRSSAREATAMTAYQSYLRSCVERPHLGTWAMFKRWSGHTKPDSLEDQDDEKSEAYVWQLSDILMTCELAMLSARNDKPWRETIRTQVSLHEASIRFLWPTWKENYSTSVQRVVSTALVDLARKTKLGVVGDARVSEENDAERMPTSAVPQAT